MFKNLTNFRFERTGKEAFGFYLAYFFVGLILGALAGSINGLVTGDESFESGLRAGNVMAIFYCPSLAIAIAYSKGLFSSFKIIILVLISSLLAVFIGALGGLIPVAYLSTMGNSRNQCKQQD